LEFFKAVYYVISNKVDIKETSLGGSRVGFDLPMLFFYELDRGPGSSPGQDKEMFLLQLLLSCTFSDSAAILHQSFLRNMSLASHGTSITCNLVY
jgi:hypothetical protein